MLPDRIEHKWIEAFARTFAICKVKAGDAVAILSETGSRALNVRLSELALLRLGARPFHVVMPSPPQNTAVPIRSTGASLALADHPGALAALRASEIVVDVTIEGLIHAKETASILASGCRILYISDEHPDVLERLGADPAMKAKLHRSIAALQQARVMHVSSPAGTDLSVNVEGAHIGGGWGAIDEPGRLGHWPGGLLAYYPLADRVNGTVVLAPGDVNLTFKRYVESPVTLRIERDRIVEILGDGLDAQLMRSQFAAWNDGNAYCTAHLGWGLNAAARWDAMVMYDLGDHNGTEQRAFEGNFLFSTGANRFANRFTQGHFDIPMRGCTIRLDDRYVVRDGTLEPAFARMDS
ncbi:MAG: peptidase M29 [Burkholderiaceae bacterium]